MIRGLGFGPTNHFNIFNTILDVYRFARVITLRNQFLRESQDTQVKVDILTETDPCAQQKASFSDLCGISILHNLQTVMFLLLLRF